jgi:putative autotransporter adhesin-like protein
MKKHFLMIAALVVVAVTAIAAGEAPKTTTRNWSVEQDFKSIAVKGNVEVVLVTADSKTISIEGCEKFVNAVYLQVENGVLVVNGAKGTAKNRTTVFVPVRDLEKVTLRGGSHLSSKGRIASKKLHIRIEGYSTVNVKNLGEVVIDSDDMYQFNYEKVERSIVRIEKA